MKHKRLNMFIITGLLFILAALSLTGFNIFKDMRASAGAAKVIQQIEIGADAAAPMNKHMELAEVKIDGVPYIGVIEIPSLELQLPVASYWDEGFAAVAPCRYAGSPYTEDMIIAGHNFREHFGRIRSLNDGDEVQFIALSGAVYSYKTVAIQNVDGHDIETMKSGDWDLTLFTCDFSGQARIAVRCQEK